MVYIPAVEGALEEEIYLRGPEFGFFEIEVDDVWVEHFEDAAFSEAGN